MKSKAGGTVTHRYVYAGQNTLLAERFGDTSTGASQWTSYLWLGGQPVGLVKGSTLYWVTSDHLGRPEVATNASQQVVWRAANQAFDRSVLVDQIGGYRLGFPGQSLDAESGLWHNGFRDYDASLGRYVQSDPIGHAGGISTFAYREGNPVLMIDVFGLDARICRYAGTGMNRWGHLGIGVGVGPVPTTGYYPKHPSLDALRGTPGQVKQDSGQPLECKTIRTTPEQDKKMLATIEARRRNPGTYSFTGNNCVQFVRNVLGSIGISTSSDITPEGFLDGIP